MEARRLTTAEKGKDLASKDTTCKRIRAPDFDFSELVKENSKTLIGRTLNHREQLVEHLVLELPKKWALRGKVLGVDLGNGCFQFRFDRDEDMQCVLLNRPYQHNNWMVILERWEPVISSTFPSKIPFWITVKGLALHFWHEKMVYNIATELGQLEDYDITMTSARIRILLEAFEPLTMESIVDFSTGEEAPITFEYERIANYCTICSILTHTSRYCTKKATQQMRSSQSNPHSAERFGEPPVGRRNSSQVDRMAAFNPSLPLSGRPSSRDNKSFHQRVDRYGRPFGDMVTSEASRVLPLRNKITPDNDTRVSPPRLNGPASLSQGRRSVKDRLQLPKPPQLQWRVRENFSTPPLPPLPPLPSEPNVITPTPTLGRNLHECEFSKQNVPTEEEVLGELREVTLQYVNCADPVESAARRRRVIQEEPSMMTKTAANIVAAATTSFTRNVLQDSPAAILLPNSEAPPTGSNMTSTTGAKRRGRPPGAKKAQANPKAMGGSAKKRIFSKIQASPARPNSTPTSARRARAITLNLPLPNAAAPTNGPSISGTKPGFHIPRTVQRLKELSQNCSPDICFLMETRNQDSFVLDELKDLNYDSHHLVSPHGHGGGGLAIIWKNHVDVKVLSANHNFIDSVTKYKNTEFFCTFVYGAPEVTHRQAVWDALSNLSATRTGAWYLTGDLNEITNNSEKSGGKERAESTFCSFRSILAQCDLFDLQHTGNFLSWRGTRGSRDKGTYVVHCRLDRTLFNSNWSDMFPTARCHYLLFEGSNHRPLLSIFDPTKLKSQKSSDMTEGCVVISK